MEKTKRSPGNFLEKFRLSPWITLGMFPKECLIGSGPKSRATPAKIFGGKRFLHYSFPNGRDDRFVNFMSHLSAHQILSREQMDHSSFSLTEPAIPTTRSNMPTPNVPICHQKRYHVFS